jgi:hypothetical protein
MTHLLFGVETQRRSNGLVVGAGVLLWRLLRRPTTASNPASSYGVYYGGGATKATGILLQMQH